MSAVNYTTASERAGTMRLPPSIRNGVKNRFKLFSWRVRAAELVNRSPSWASRAECGDLNTFIVRHAKAERRSDWDGPDPLRPLSPKGLRQSQALARELASQELTRIVSSPHLRCTQTVERLAAETGLPIEFDERLAEREQPEKTLELLREVKDGSTVLCSHGGVIAGLMSELEDRGAALETGGRFRCQKSSTWLVRQERGRAPHATYQPPPPLRRRRIDVVDRERVAVLDLGSTSFRLVVFETTRAGALKPLMNKRLMLRLGAAIGADGLIPEKHFDRALDAAKQLGCLAQDAGVSRVLPVATEALRSARNGRALSKKIGVSLGTRVRIISGEDEARYLFRAFQRRVPLRGELALGFDLGGGSLELAVGDAREIQWAVSLPIGVTRLHRELATRDPMRKRDVRRIRQRVLEELEPVRSSIEDLVPRSFIASGGTARAFADLARARGGRTREGTNGLYEMPVRQLEKLTQQLVRADRDERLTIPGLRKDRVDLLATGGILLTALADFLEIDAYTTCDWGLREGVVLEFLRKR